MTKRVIYEVYAKIVDANGNYNTLTNYPKAFDSRNNDNDADKTLLRATGEFHDTVGSMCKNDTRQLQTVILMAADGFVIDRWTHGAIADVPDAE